MLSSLLIKKMQNKGFWPETTTTIMGWKKSITVKGNRSGQKKAPSATTGARRGPFLLLGIGRLKAKSSNWSVVSEGERAGNIPDSAANFLLTADSHF